MKKPVIFLLCLIVGILLGVLAYSSYQLIHDKVEHSQSRSMDTVASKAYEIPSQSSPTPRVYEACTT